MAQGLAFRGKIVIEGRSGKEAKIAIYQTVREQHGKPFLVNETIPGSPTRYRPQCESPGR